MSAVKAIAMATASLALMACGHVETHEVVLRAPTDGATHDPDLYVEGKGPGRPFYEVALLQVIGFGTDANPDDVTLALLSRARSLGCDAVVRAHVDQGSARASGFGVCVRWSPVLPPPNAPVPPAPPKPMTPPDSAPPAPPSSSSPTQL